MSNNWMIKLLNILLRANISLIIIVYRIILYHTIIRAGYFRVLSLIIIGWFTFFRAWNISE